MCTRPSVHFYHRSICCCYSDRVRCDEQRSIADSKFNCSSSVSAIVSLHDDDDDDAQVVSAAAASGFLENSEDLDR